MKDSLTIDEGSLPVPRKILFSHLAAVIFLLILLAAVLAGIGGDRGPALLGALALTFAAVKIFLSTALPATAKRLFSPCGFCFFSYLFFAGAGALNYFATEQFLFSYYEIDFARGSLYLSAGLLALTAGMWAAAQAPLRPPRNKPRLVDNNRLFILSLVFSTVVLALNLYLWVFIAGGVPVLVGFLRENIFAEGGLGRFGRVVHLTVVAQILWYFYLLNGARGGRRLIAAASLAVMILVAGGYGARFYFFLPLLFFLLYLSRRMKSGVNLVAAAGAAAILLVVSAAVINIRGGESVRLDSLLELVFSRIGVRGRDFFVLTDYFRDLEGFLRGFSLLPIVTNILPAPVWQLFGIVKSSITASGGMFLSEFFFVPFYVNTGIIGEFYLNGGLPLIIGGIFLYGYLVCRLYRRWERTKSSSVRSLVYAYLLANLSVSLTAGHFYGLSFWSYQYGLLLLLLGSLTLRRE